MQPLRRRDVAPLVISTRIPPLSLLLGFGPAVVQLACGIAALAAPDPDRLWLFGVGQLWAVAILLFLAGVRRGLSFFTEGGARPIQIATMMWLFVLGLAGAVLPGVFAIMALMLGFLSVAVLDPPAAGRGEVPAHFAKLRPLQMAVFTAGLALLAVAARGVRVH